MTWATASAGDVKKGYRGFVDVEMSWTNWRIADSYIRDSNGKITVESTRNKSFYLVDWITMSHGYQFNPRFYLGIGFTLFGIEDLNDTMYSSAFLHARTDQTFGKFTPFADIRVGATTLNSSGNSWSFYCSPTIGYRFNFGHRVNLNLSIGMTLTTTDHDDEVNVCVQHSTMEITNVVLGKCALKSYLTARVGIDF